MNDDIIASSQLRFNNHSTLLKRISELKKDVAPSGIKVFEHLRYNAESIMLFDYSLFRTVLNK